MATTNIKDEATRQRIVKHMNTEHRDSIRRYVEAYASRSMFQSRSAKMIDIHLDKMVFSCGDQHALIRLDPPMTTLSESRERMAKMDKDALETLGRSDISITRFVPAYTRPAHLWNFTQCLLAYLLLPRAANWQPGSPIYDYALFMVPSFANFVARYGWLIFMMMLPIHSIEAVIMVMRLAKHGCTFLDGVWWKWVGTCFVEGITSFWRLDALIEERKREKEKKAKRH
ncbi:hypothetical protein J3E71DRAFT_262962 [Bipolaris maydis]|nr:hypothetical protein J3E71DRAFT_262962 [Bipolaris maydis]